MRYIKFRFWDKERKEFEILDLNKSEHGEKIGFKAESQSFGEYEECVKEQYTGIKDIDEKEIYEGDIVYFKHPSSTRNNGKYIVVYQPKKCGLGLKSTSKYKSYTGMQPGKHLKIIGNIHENPELTKEV